MTCFSTIRPALLMRACGIPLFLLLAAMSGQEPT